VEQGRHPAVPRRGLPDAERFHLRRPRQRRTGPSAPSSPSGPTSTRSGCTAARTASASCGHGTPTPCADTLADFSLNTISGRPGACHHCSLGNYEGNISDDDHLIALVCNTLANRSGQWDVMRHYDPIRRQRGARDAGERGRGTSTTVASRSSGSDVYVDGTADGSGTFQGCPPLTPLRWPASARSPAYRLRHLDMGYDTSGNEVLVDAQGGNMHRLSDGTTTDIFPGATKAVEGGHVSCRNIDQPGWASSPTPSRDARPGRGSGRSSASSSTAPVTCGFDGCHHEVSAT